METVLIYQPYETSRGYWIDSDLTKEQALYLEGAQIIPPDWVMNRLEVITVEYLSYDDTFRVGQIVCYDELVDDVICAFAVALLHQERFQCVAPACLFGYDDQTLMEKGVTHMFNPRYKTGLEEPSEHFFARALDANQNRNPCIYRNGIVLPSTAVYDPSLPGTFTKDSAFVKALLTRGWTCGMFWEDPVDIHHFEKQFRKRPY